MNACLIYSARRQQLSRAFGRERRAMRVDIRRQPFHFLALLVLSHTTLALYVFGLVLHNWITRIESSYVRARPR